MGTKFAQVYNRFLGKITDDMYVELTPEDTMRDMQHLLISAIPEFEFPRKRLDDYEIKMEVIDENGDTNVEIITLDSCKEADGTVGWIKIDLEGYGLPAVKGMVETIKRDRPVLTLAVYHCADELFGIKKLLESLELEL